MDGGDRGGGAVVTQSAARWAYAGISAAVLLLVAVTAIVGEPGHDLWEHAAVVRELATRPFAPVHPQVIAATPHVWFTPYHLLAGLASRFLDADAMSVLQVVGVLNTLALLAFLRMLLLRVFGDERVALYSLIFTLVLWGIWPWAEGGFAIWPWSWSGFVHLRILPAAAPYASTFAFALALALLCVFDKALADRSTVRAALVAPMAAVLVLSHPPTAVPAYVGMGALLVARIRDASGVRAAVLPVLSAGIGGLLAFAWPYFPLLGLATGQGAEYSEYYGIMFDEPLKRVYPALLGLPAAVALARADRRNPIPWFAAAIAGIYLFGWGAGVNGLGRTAAWVVLTLHVSLAWWVATNEAAWIGRHAPVWRKLVSIGAVGAVAAFALLFSVRPAMDIAAGRGFERAIRQALTRVGSDDVVLSDLWTSYRVPGVAGRVVAIHLPMALVEDRAERRADVLRFFSAEATSSERADIADRRGARWVLLNAEQEVPAPAESLMALGDSVTSAGPLILLRLAMRSEQ